MSTSNRILIVDDNISIHRDFTSILGAREDQGDDGFQLLERQLFGDDAEADQCHAVEVDYEVDSAYQGEEALHMIRRAHDQGRPYTLVFMDVRMPPGWDGIETVERVWHEFPEIEVVICSAYTDYSWDKIIERLGETDRLLFLAKPFDPIEVKQMALTLCKKSALNKNARNYIADLEDQVAQRTQQLEEVLAELERKNGELKSTNEDLQYQALHDDLTGLPNRILFRDRLQRSIRIATRANNSFAVLLLDANDFKQINDTYGHHAGDAVLSEISQRLTRTLRGSDTVARLGGDEFAIILNNISRAQAVKLSDAIAKAIEPPMKIETDRDPLVTRVSIGIAMFPEHGGDQDTLLKNADEAMYRAKGRGDGCELYDESHIGRPTNRARLVNDLKLALSESESGFSVHYQPIVDAISQRPHSVEALARWTHSQFGKVGPDEFVPLAESNGLIQQLTLKVFDSVIQQLATWQSDRIDIGASINISTSNFLDPVIMQRLREMLTQHNISPEKLKLEITESMTISNPRNAQRIIEELKEIGIKISIDDFGTGYSSLAYLQDLPVDELKIDQMFVRDLHGRSSAKAGAIVKSTIDLAYNLGLSVVAEGVESERDVRALIAMGCDKLQGHFICQPQSAAAITEWLSKHARLVSAPERQLVKVIPAAQAVSG